MLQSLRRHRRSRSAASGGLQAALLSEGSALGYLETLNPELQTKLRNRNPKYAT